jgi:putative tricarboxylic transport membrane protein
MTSFRADHVAGTAFILFGVVIIALSGDLPTGQLSMPGAGFMPMILAVLMIVFGAALVFRAKESKPFSEIDWGDLPHAAKVLAISAAAIALYTVLGFIITLVLMMVALLLIIERKNLIHAAGYSILVVVVTYLTFEYLLKTPLPDGPFGY